MRSRFLVTLVTLFTLSVLSPARQAQGGQGGNRQAAAAPPEFPSIPFPDGWKPCPRCQNNADRAAVNRELKVEGRAFNPRDLTGVWGWDGVSAAFRADAIGAPPLTAEGK